MYIAIINIHGLVRGNDIEMGRDADTGGQTRYVVDLIKELSAREHVEVDLFTRKIADKRLAKEYRQSSEQVGKRGRIVRLPCGGAKYIRKEKLWPYLDEYVDNLIEFFRSEMRDPDIIHGHYADGDTWRRRLPPISELLGISRAFVGSEQADYLKASGVSDERIEEYYAMSQRIANENRRYGNRHGSSPVQLRT